MIEYWRLIIEFAYGAQPADFRLGEKVCKAHPTEMLCWMVED